MNRFFAVFLVCLTLAACKSSEERAEEAYQSGMELLEAGDDDRARIEFRNAIRLSAEHVPAQLELGRLNLEEGSLRPAFRNFLAVAEFEPDNQEAQIVLSQISFLNNDWESFQRYSQRAVDIAGETIEGQIIDLVRRYREAALNEDNAARSALVDEASNLLDQAPEDRLLRRLLVDGYLAEGRYEDALEQVEKSISAEPQNSDLYQLKVQILASLGDNSGVEEELRRMVEVFPDNSEYESSLLRFLLGRGKVEEAETFLRDRIAAAEPGDMEPYVSLIQFLSLRQSQDAAMAELERTIDENPESHQLRAIRAAMQFEMGQRDAGISEMEELVSLEAGTEALSVEEQQRYKVTLAKMLSATGNEIGARRLVEEILSEDSTDVDALKMRAGWMIEDDEPGAAITTLRTAMSERPEDAEAMTLMANAYERSGQADLMMDFLSLAAETSNNAPAESIRFAEALLAQGRAERAQSVLMSALRMQPSNVAVLSLLGRVYLEQDDLPRARQIVETLRGMDDAEAETIANGMELQIVSIEEGGEQALEFLARMAEESGGNDQIKLAYMRGLLESGDVEQALQYADNLLEEDPERWAFIYFKAVAEAAARQFDDARATLEELTASQPEFVESWLLLSRLQAANGEQEEAAATIETALSHIPDAPELLWARATNLEEAGDIDGAIEVYESLYETNSDSVVVANNLASLIATYKSDADSLQRARQISLRLKDAEIPALQDTYGWILHLSGDSEAALPYLESAAEALQDDPVVQTHLGHVYHALGRMDDAANQLDRARSATGVLTPAAVTEKIDTLEQTLQAN